MAAMNTACSVIVDFGSALARVRGMAKVKFGLLANWHFLGWMLSPSGGQISSSAVPLILTLEARLMLQGACRKPRVMTILHGLKHGVL